MPSDSSPYRSAGTAQHHGDIGAGLCLLRDTLRLDRRRPTLPDVEQDPTSELHSDG
jgi:hypothetical protein